MCVDAGGRGPGGVLFTFDDWDDLVFFFGGGGVDPSANLLRVIKPVICLGYRKTLSYHWYRSFPDIHRINKLPN